jgi:hypothetical protein
MAGGGQGEIGWVRLASPAEPANPSLRASQVAVAVLPAAAALVVLRRRARRRAVQSAWRQRTHGEVSAENRRMVDAHDADDRGALDVRRSARPNGRS